MAALEEKYPELAVKIENETIDTDRYKTTASDDGEPNVMISRESDILMLYDNDSPFNYCKTYFEELNIKYAPVVVFLGFGLGYHLYLFSKMYANRLGSKKILVFEEDISLFRLALEMVDLEVFIRNPDIYFFVGDEPEKSLFKIRREILAEDHHIYMRSFKVIPLPSHISLDSEYYTRVVKTVKNASCQMMITAGNDPMDSLLGMENIFGNLENIVSHPGINLLYEKFKGMPAVTVASGPSLNKNMHLLRELRDRALIICCDASLKPLMNRGIRPHIVVTMERTDGTDFFYENVPDFEGMYLAFCPLVRPRTFDSFKGKKIIVHRTFLQFDWLRHDKGQLLIGPSVANMAFTIAQKLGCDPIILTGQDLALAEDGDTHVQEMPFGECDDYYHKDILEVEGNDGNPVKTSKTWFFFRKALEEDVNYYPGLCINATEGGARIRGTEIMPLQEAIERYCQRKIDPESIMEKTLEGFGKDLDTRKELETFLSRLGETRVGTRKLLEKYIGYRKEIHEVHKNMINPFIYEGKKIDSVALMKIIEKVTDILESRKSIQSVYEVVGQALQPPLLWFYNKMNSLPEFYSDEECLRSAQVLAIKDVIGTAGQLLVSTLDLVEKSEKRLAEQLGSGHAAG